MFRDIFDMRNFRSQLDGACFDQLCICALSAVHFVEAGWIVTGNPQVHGLQDFLSSIAPTCQHKYI